MNNSLRIWFKNGDSFTFSGVEKLNENDFGVLTFNHTDYVSCKTAKASFDTNNIAGYSYVKEV